MAAPSYPVLTKLDLEDSLTFQTPVKRINDGSDVTAFLSSFACRDITAFLLQLNHAMFPRRDFASGHATPSVQTFPLSPGSDVNWSTPAISALRHLLAALQENIAHAPPDPGPQRFGNRQFRQWCQLLEDSAEDRLKPFLQVVMPTAQADAAATELAKYLSGGFGSNERLDYGTGHELSFLALIGGLWKLNVFGRSTDGNVEREIVLGIFQAYFELVRTLIKTYNLEPAGSHGVWGLDDHAFLPYIFGSAQYGPAIRSEDPTPVEGSIPNAPPPGDVAKANAVDRERGSNLYFSAIGFIYDVKKGPFWEHSPMLYDISGITAGWGKINKGMLKMYHAEVLSKFPVVQHFPFGFLYSFEHDPQATTSASTTHLAHQPTAVRSGASRAEASTSSMMTGVPWQRQTAPMARTTRPLEVTPQTQRDAAAALQGLRAGSHAARQRQDTGQRKVDSVLKDGGEGHTVPTKESSDQASGSTSASMAPPPTRAPWAK